jgi:hypothetical protein
MNFIELKSSVIYSLFIIFNTAFEIEAIYKAISFVIFVGYNLHRWYIMYKNDKKNLKNPIK